MKTKERISIVDSIVKWKNYHKPFCAYVYDLIELTNHVKNLKGSLPPQCELFYAMKANPDQNILKTIAPYIDGFEIASLGEMKKLNHLSIPKPKVLSGPVKTDETLKEAILNEVDIIHVESAWELERILFLTEQFQKEARIALRINLQATISGARLIMAGKPTQFGIDEREVGQLIQIAQQHPLVELVGFHFHSVSNNLDAEAHCTFVSHCLKKVAQWERENNLHVSYINVGGGVGIHYEKDDKPFDWELFTFRLKEVLHHEAKETWKVIFELGRYMVAKCGYYASEVIDIKENHGEHFVLIRGGSHHLRLPAAWKMSHPFQVISIDDWSYSLKRPFLMRKSVTIAGELCTPNDVLVRNIFCEQVRVGDIILFKMAGAYAWTISHHDFLSHEHPEFFYIQ